jgi:two-component system, NarL family, nitrate/nitrite response regulator NarL
MFDTPDEEPGSMDGKWRNSLPDNGEIARRFPAEWRTPTAAVRASACASAVEPRASGLHGGSEHWPHGSPDSDAVAAADQLGRQTCWPSVRLVLCSDQRLCMDALAAALAQRGVVVAALARTQQEVLAAVASQEPDVCLVSAGRPGSSCIDIISPLRAWYPALRVVVMTDGPNSSVLTTRADIGTATLVNRHVDVTELVAILHCVRAGVRWTEPGSGPVKIHARNRETTTDGDSRLAQLTIREQEVLKLMMDGMATKDIARSLEITIYTARTHSQRVLAKLGAHSRLEASGMAARHGWAGPSGECSLSRVSEEAGPLR